ncbi:DUF5050 domain-containing protein [Clostridium sp.]|uniref:DUF5050 domain-containing protein n=1 Tax=Clostridium sp. TaxID=1506 RepID=UPI0026048B11|nr:DUF5050 domain-containing protein [Clostridium sp.]
MLKKLISALFLSTLLLVSCSTQTNETPKENAEVSSNKVTVSDNSESNKNVVLSGKTLYSNKYLYIENLLFFPDPLNNNNLSMAKTSVDDTSVSNGSIIDFYPYSLVSIDKNDTTIYFSSNSQDSGLFKLDYVNSKITKISDSIPLEMFFIEDKIVYVNSKDKYIYYYDLKKNENILLSNNKSSNLIYNNNFIFYTNLDDSSHIYSVKIDGTNKHKITDVAVDSLAIYNNNLFYFDGNNNNILSSINISTQKVTKYLNIKGQNLKEYDGTMYYISTENPNALYSLSEGSDSNSFEGTLIYSDFVNDYFPNSNGIFIEKASNPEEITILKK